MSTSSVHQRQTPPRQRRHHGHLLTFPLLAGGVVAVAAVGFILYVLWPAWQGAPLGPNAPALPVTIAGAAFNVPPAAIRAPIQRQPGAHERLDLSFLWPSLQPPDGAPLPNVPTKGLPKQQSFERVFVTLAVARDLLSPSERVKAIYPRYVETQPIDGPDGLIVLPFRQGTPYQGEDLIYDETAPENFLVRCSRDGAAGTPGTCLYVKRIGDADVTVRFPREWLKHWQPVASNIEQLITRLQSHGH